MGVEQAPQAADQDQDHQDGQDHREQQDQRPGAQHLELDGAPLQAMMGQGEVILARMVPRKGEPEDRAIGRILGDQQSQHAGDLDLRIVGEHARAQHRAGQAVQSQDAPDLAPMAAP